MQNSLEPSRGIVAGHVDVARYGNQVYDPDEVTGLVCEYVAPGSRVLDVGCGTGTVSCILRDRNNATIVGIEPSPERARLARGRGIEVIESYLTDEVANSLGQFDAVVFADVLEHMADPETILSCVRKRLNPGGMIVVSVPNVAHWTVRLNLCRGRFDYESDGIMDATHLRWFTKASLHRVLEAAGFVVCKSKYTAGMSLPVYSRSVPWRWVSRRVRQGVIRRAARVWPAMFGAQVVVQARLA